LNIAAWAQNHIRSLLFLIAALIVGGIASGLRLPVALLPHVDFPRVQISLDAGDRPAERMVVEVTYPVEEVVRSIPGVRGVRSITSRGSAEISINFDWGEDMTAAQLQAESQVNRILTRLPAGTRFDLRRMDPTVFPVVAYSLASDSQTLVQLYDLATYDLRPRLSSVDGVAKIAVLGGNIQEFQVIVDSDKLRSFDMTVDDVAKALQATNVLEAVGKLEDHDKLYLLVSDTRLKTLESINESVIRTNASGVVRLSDVATLIDTVQPQFTRVTADGADAVLLMVYQQPGGNTVQIASEVKRLLAEFKMPAGVKLANWYDQSELIVASATSVRDAVLIGMALAALVLLLFLRNLKITLIAVLLVPSVLAATVLLLGVAGMSFNIMTLGGMAAAVGLIIDDAIVMIEHLVRRLHSPNESSLETRVRISNAAHEFTRPLFGSSMSTIIIFIPLAFLSGITGAFFKALSLTMAISLIFSLVFAWLALPILSAKVLSEKDFAIETTGWLTRTVDRVYARSMRFMLAAPWLICLLIAPLLIGGFYCYKNVGSGFMPTMDEGGFILDYVAPAGTSLTETDRRLRLVEQILIDTPEVETYSRRTGIQLGGGLTEPSNGDYFIRLKPLPRRPLSEVMDEVRSRVELTVPGLEIETLQLMEDLIGDLTAVPQPIEIKLYCDDQQTLETLAPQLADEIGKIAGVVEVKDGIVLAGDALEISVDRVKASLEGVDPDSVTRMLTDMLDGAVTTQVQQGPKLIDVRVWLPASSRQITNDIPELMLRAPDGHMFPLKRVATINTLTGQPEITRDNLKRMVPVTGRISGRDMGSAVADVKARLDQPGTLPAGVTYELGGLYQQQQIAFRGLLVVIIAAVSLVFLLLLFLYESFLVALALMVTTLLAMTGVFIGLWLTGVELNISSIMGMTMIVGIATEVGIFYFSEYRELSKTKAGPAEAIAGEVIGTAEQRRQNRERRVKRLIDAGTNRLRAITMTTLAAILALLPLALAIGQGSAMQQPLAIAIIAGLSVQLPLVLVVLPCLLAVGRQD
jgi:CzcA family heavy metal efflux pump